jgi:hypothetical protein
MKCDKCGASLEERVLFTSREWFCRPCEDGTDEDLDWDRDELDTKPMFAPWTRDHSWYPTSKLSMQDAKRYHYWLQEAFINGKISDETFTKAHRALWEVQGW